MADITLTLYNNASAPNVVFKNKSVLGTLTGDLKENTNREHVEITIPYQSNFASINYAYIPEYRRYYYVSVECRTGGLLHLSMDSDGLSSFWNDYKVSPCIARRSTSNYNTDIPDDLIHFKSQPIYIRRKTPQHFTPSSSGGCYVLTIGGK